MTELELKSFVKDTVNTLAEIYNIDCIVTFGKTSRSWQRAINPRWGKHETANYCTYKSNKSRLHFGIPCIKSHYNHGWDEYKTVKDALPEYNFKSNGITGVLMLICHEFTHAVDSKMGYERANRHYSYHGRQFIKNYKDVLELVL